MGLFHSRSESGAAGKGTGGGQPSPFEPFDPLTAVLPPTSGPPVPLRLRLVTPAGPGDWLPGAMRLNPGSILWVPQAGVRAVPVELATAPVVSVTRERKAGFDVIELEAALGRVQIDHDAGLFEMVQEEVAEMAASQPPGDPSAPMG